MTPADIAAAPPLDAKALAARWGMRPGETFWQIVDNRDVPFFFIGGGEPRKGERGPRGLYRFRLESIIRWERDQERSFGQPRLAGDPVPAPEPTVAKIHDGKIRGGRSSGRRKAPARA